MLAPSALRLRTEYRAFAASGGENHELWRLRLRAICRAKKLWHLVDPSAASVSRVLASDQDIENKEFGAF